MKSSAFLLLCMLLLLFNTGCRKDKHEQIKLPKPDWVANTSSAYPYSMTAVIALPDDLQKDMTSSDKMAAFVGEDCRGVSVIVSRNNDVPVFYILIKGSASEQSKVSFQYYSTKRSFIFKTDASLSFIVDDNYGIIDEPATPAFKPIF